MPGVEAKATGGDAARWRICLRFAAVLPNLPAMRDENFVPVPKWPFFLGDAAMIGFGYFIYYETRGPLGHWEFVACALCISLGAVLGILPFLLDHRARLKQIEANALGNVSEKIQNLEQLAAQISSATNAWENIQLQAEKTSQSAQEVSERMAAEARDFAEFMRQANDTEKATLRLEVEKLRRAEMEWLQVVVHMFDHVYALQGAAVRSGQTRVVEQLTQFRNACLEAARRVGLTAFAPAPGEAFDPQRHRNPDSETMPPDSIVAEVAAVGFTFQGQLLRPALVKVSASQPAAAPAPAVGAAPVPSQLTLEGQG